MAQLIKKSLMLLLCAAVLLMVVNVTTTEAKALEPGASYTTKVTTETVDLYRVEADKAGDPVVVKGTTTKESVEWVKKEEPKKAENAVSTWSTRNSYKVVEFKSFSALKKLCAATYSDVTQFSYTGTKTLVIEEDLTIPENAYLMVYGKVEVAKGATLKLPWCDWSTYIESLVINGTVENKAYIYGVSNLTIKGKLKMQDGAVTLNEGATVSGLDKVVYENDWVSIRYNLYVENTTGLKNAISAANKDTTGLRYEISFYADGSTSISSNITVPENVYLNCYGATITIPSGKTLTNNGEIYIASNMVIKGNLVNNKTINLGGYNWNTDKVQSVKFSDGSKYSGNGRIYLYKDGGYFDEYTDVVKGLSTTNLEVSEDEWSITLRNVAGLTKLSKPTSLAWGKGVEYDSKTEKYTEISEPGSISFKMGKDVDKNSTLNEYVIKVYKDGKLFETFYYGFNDSYRNNNVPCVVTFGEDTELTDGKYYFTVQATTSADDCCDSDIVKSDTWTYKKPSSKMTKATGVKWDWPVAKWTGVSGHDKYQIRLYYAATKNAEPQMIYWFNVSGTKWDLSNYDNYYLKNIVEWYGPGYLSFDVRVISKDITKKWHSDWTSKSAQFYFDGVTSLNAPKVEISNDAATGKNKLSWDKVDGAAKYQVYRATSKSGDYERLITTSKTSYTDKDATAGKTYYYKVRAVSEGGVKSKYSSIVSRTCDLARPDVTATNVASTGKIKLSWAKVSGASKYEVYRATSKDGTYKLLKTTTSTSYTNTSAEAGKTYYYKVKAIHSNSSANSAYSTVDSRTCDLAQPEVTAKLSSGKVKITWEKVSGAKEYKVYRATSKDGTYKLLKTTTGTSLTNTSVEAGKTYYYKVMAVHEKSAANSAYSSIVSVKVK